MCSFLFNIFFLLFLQTWNCNDGKVFRIHVFFFSLITSTWNETLFGSPRLSNILYIFKSIFWNESIITKSRLIKKNLWISYSRKKNWVQKEANNDPIEITMKYIHFVPGRNFILIFHISYFASKIHTYKFGMWKLMNNGFFCCYKYATDNSTVSLIVFGN